MKKELLTSRQALEILSLKNYRYLNYLVRRNLLPRVVLGPNTFRYEKEDVEHLLHLTKTKGVQLTLKP